MVGTKPLPDVSHGLGKILVVNDNLKKEVPEKNKKLSAVQRRIEKRKLMAKEKK
jgi:hypothetical protein